jgi:Golgi phosphoprotein 3 (GPP34)
MLLAEELALIALDPDSGRHAMGIRDKLNACLAGLLIVDAQLDDTPDAPIVQAAGEILEQSGPKLKSVLSAMNRGLERRVGHGTWDAVVQGLVAAEVVAPADGVIRPRHRVLDAGRRDEIVQRLRAAAGSDDPMPARTAILLSMTGPAQLLELVAPQRSTRKHARRRIDHALDDTSLGPVAESVRKVLADAAAAVAVASSVAVMSAATSSS